MTFAKLTASTAVLLLSSTALVAQESTSRTFENVYLDVEGSAVLVPVDLALEACGLDEAGIQQAANSRLDTSGMNAEEVFAQINSGDPIGGAAAGTESQDAAAASAGASADASTGMADTGATADASEAAATGDAAATAAEPATADASAADTTREAGSTDMAAADASGAADAAAEGTQTTDTATADASGAAGQDATAAAPEGSAETAAAGDAAQSGDAPAGSVENVEATAAESNTTVTNAQGTADPSTSAPGQELLALAVCQIDVVRASELGIPNIANETVTE